METEQFDADAAFEQAAAEIESGGQPADSQTSVAKPVTDTPDQRETESASPPQPEAESADGEGEAPLPDWLANATDEVKENFLRLQAENRQLAHRERSQRGRVGALSKKWQQAQAALEQVKQSQGSYDQEIENLTTDYPELATLLSRIVADNRQHLNAISAPMAEVAEANVRGIALGELQSRVDYVHRLIPNAREIVQTTQFQAWFDQQPTGVKALFNSDDPNDAVYLLSEYQKSASAQTAQRQKRQQQISALSLPNGRNSPKGGEEIDEEALFDKIAADLDRQRLR